MNFAGSEQRNATTLPKSAASPTMPAGTRFAISSIGPMPLMRSVAWTPGCTELTVTPSFATSVASTLRKLVTAARAVEEAASVGIGERAPAEVIATMRPQRRSRIAGSACWHMTMVESVFSSSASR